MTPIALTLALVAGQPHCGTGYVQQFAAPAYGAYHAPAYANAYHTPAYHAPTVLIPDAGFVADRIAAYVEARLAGRLDRIEAKVSAPAAPAIQQPPAATLPPVVVPPPPPASAAFVPPPDPIVPQPPAAALERESWSTPATHAALLAALTRNRCGTCHTGEAASGGVAIFEAPGKLGDVGFEGAMKVATAVKNGTMPPKGPPVSSEDRALIVKGIQEQIVAAAKSLDD